MLIELKAPINARRDDGSWVTLPEGMRVNYSGERQGENMVHRVSAQVYQGRVGVGATHVEVTLVSESPPWL